MRSFSAMVTLAFAVVDPEDAPEVDPLEVAGGRPECVVRAVPASLVLFHSDASPSSRNRNTSLVVQLFVRSDLPLLALAKKAVALPLDRAMHCGQCAAWPQLCGDRWLSRRAATCGNLGEFPSSLLDKFTFLLLDFPLPILPTRKRGGEETPFCLKNPLRARLLLSTFFPPQLGLWPI